MKKESWKQKLLRDTEIRLPEGRQAKNDAYLPPEPIDAVPHKQAWKRRLPYAAAAVAAAAVLVTGLSVHWHHAGPDLPAAEATPGGVMTVVSTAASSRATTLQTTSATTNKQASNTRTTQSNRPATGTTVSSAAVPAVSAGELSLKLGFTSEKVDGEFAAYAQLADGGYVATGNTQAFADLRTPGNDQRSAMAVRYDAAGKIQYIRLFGGDGSDTFYQVIATRDGGFLAYGNTSSLAGGDFDRSGIQGVPQDGTTLIVKYDADGNVLWARTGASVRAHNITGYAAKCVCETADGSLAGVVESYADNSKGIQYYRFHWDASGKPLTEEEYVHVDLPVDHLADVRLNQDGSLTGVGNRGEFGSHTGVFFRLNADGSQAFATEFPFLYFGNMLETDDGQFLINGTFSRHTRAADLQRAGAVPPAAYQEKKSYGVVMIKLTADGKLVGGDMLIGLDSSNARCMTPLGGGETLVQVHDMGKFIDPLTGETRPQSRVYFYRVGTDGKLAKLHTSSSDLLVGVYSGVDGFIRQPDGSMQVICLENSSPSYIRVLELTSWG